MHIFGGVLDFIEVIPAFLTGFTDLPAQIFRNSVQTIIQFLISVTLPAIPTFVALQKTNVKDAENAKTLFGSEMAFNFLTSFAILILEGLFIVSIIISDEYGGNGGWFAMGWSMYFFMTLLMSVVRG